VKKRLLPALLALAMLLTMLPMSALAVDETTEATVTIGSGEPQKTEIKSGIHTFTATASDTFTLLKSGSDGIEGNNANQYGYFPKIVMPTVAQEAQANTYYILSRGQNSKGLDDEILNVLMETAVNNGNLTEGPFTQGGDSLATWFQVYTSEQWGGANSAYWPQIGNAPVTNIVVATKTETVAKTVTYSYEKYRFDFSAATIPLPFTVKATTDSELDGTDMTAENLQANVTASATTATLGEKKIAVTGTSKWVDFPWFGTDRTEANYVAVTFKPVDKAPIKEFVVTLSDDSTKKLDSDGVLIWQFNEGKTNADISFKVTFGDQEHTGASIVYHLDCSAMILEPKPAAGEVEGSVTDSTLAPEENAVKDAVTAQADDSEANSVNITVTLPEDVEEEDAPAKTSVPLNTGALNALKDCEKSLVIETPKGGVSGEAKELISKIGKDESVNFVMEDTTADGATDNTQTFTVGFFKGDNEIEVKDLAADKKLTLTFKTGFEKGTAVTVKGGDEEFGEKTVGEGGIVEVETTHLSDWEIKLKTNDDGITVNYVTNEQNFLGGHIIMSGLSSEKWYVFQITRGTGTNTVKSLCVLNLESENFDGTFAWNAQQGGTFDLWEVKDGVVFPTKDSDLGEHVIESWTIAPTPAN